MFEQTTQRLSALHHQYRFIYLFLFLCPTATLAWDFDIDRVPNGESFSCDTCHGSSTHQMNAFGNAYNNAGDTWTVTLADADSDGDGYSNGEELLDPSGSWQIGQSDPGDSADVTNPGDAASHPTGPTPTGAPSSTPGPTQTPSPSPTPFESTATPGPTMTPGECTLTGVSIVMPATIFSPGDSLYCQVNVCNQEGQTLTGYPLLVLLDVFGQYYFAPSFGSDLDYYSLQYPVGSSTVDILPQFPWPQGAGSADGIVWYAALTDPSISSLFGEMDSLSFGWRE